MAAMVAMISGMENIGISAMNESLRRYLEWRFRVNNRNQYQHYMKEWISGLVDSQLFYFEREMQHMIDNGQYK